MSYGLRNLGIGMSTIAPAYVQTSFGSTTRVVSHPDYQQLFNEYMTAMGQMQAQTTGNPKQFHYTAGELASKEYE